MTAKIILPEILFGEEISSESVFNQLQVEFTKAVEERLEEKNMSKSQLAMKLGVSRSAMSKLLKPSNNISLRKIAEIATALRMDVELKFTNRNFQNKAKYTFNIKETKKKEKK